MDLLEIKKYAIDHRVEIRFSDPRNTRECLVSSKGQVKIPGEDKDFRVEEVFDTAENFVIVNNGNPRHLTRQAMTKVISESSRQVGSGADADEEE